MCSSFADGSADIAKSHPNLVFDIGVTSYRSSEDFYQGEPICLRAGIRWNIERSSSDGVIQIGSESSHWYESITFIVQKIEDDPAQSLQSKELLNDVAVKLLGPQSNKRQ